MRGSITARGGTTHIELGSAYLPHEVQRITRLARELRLTNQILSTDLDTVSVVESGPAPAWTTLDGDHVSFAASAMPKPVSRIDVAVWLGTNAHELGHVLYSPRRSSVLMQRIIEGDRMLMKGLAQLANIVEDQRQERLILGRFAPWRTYLTAALGHHLKADTDTAWLLMAGRTWLPDEVRANARRRFEAAWDRWTAREVAEIVGEYQRLVDPGDTEADEAWDLLNRLYELFEGHMPKMPPPCSTIEGGEPDTGEAGESAPAAADEADDADGEGQGGAETDAQDADIDRDNPGTGAGSTPGKPRQPADLGKQLTDAARRQIQEDEEAAGDLDDILDALRYGRGGDEVEGESPVGNIVTATDTARRLHREVGDALLDLKDQSEPGWLKRVDSGRLSVRRLVNPNVDPDELFDRYEPGQMDAAELEVVLLLDVSGSMQGQTAQLAEATWAIRHAVDDLEGECAVLTWDSGPHRVLAQAGERPDERMFIPSALGGTEPSSALAEAYRRLADSQARNRLMVVLTDGHWWGSSPDAPSRASRLIDGLNAEGVVTVCALLGEGSGTDLHHCTYGGRIDDPLELARMFRRIAAERIGAWRR